MSHQLTRVALRVAAGFTAVGLVAGGLLLSSQGAATAGTTTVTLDHFLCYQARVAAPAVPPNVLISNAIQPNPFAPTFGAATTHCNPANKSVPVALFKAKNPLAHLLCWKITSTTTAAIIEVANQFGKALMKTGNPSKLCLPTWKDNLAAIGSAQGVAPKGLDHFTCYPVMAIAGSYGFKPPSFVKVEDEFSAPRYVPLKLSRANEVCVPTLKVVAGVAYPPQGANDPSLVCFPTSPTPVWKTVFDSNQFGQETVYPNNKGEKFCLPSTLSVQSPAA